VHRRDINTVHEDDGTFIIEDLRYKDKSMVHGNPIRTCKSKREMDSFIKYLLLGGTVYG